MTHAIAYVRPCPGSGIDEVTCKFIGQDRVSTDRLVHTSDWVRNDQYVAERASYGDLPCITRISYLKANVGVNVR